MSLTALIEKFKGELRVTNGQGCEVRIQKHEILKLIEAAEVMRGALELYDKNLRGHSPHKVLLKVDEICKDVSRE